MSKKCYSVSNNGNTVIHEFYDPPESLDDILFHGFQLDEEQKKFRDAIWNKDKIAIFCNARAGTGKTQIATAVADLLCKYRLYEGIVYIVSPTQEQVQGYLAGSIDEKSEPYFEPFYQALIKVGVDPASAVTSNIANKKHGTAYIECRTHTYLRGVNFENKVVIIDEAQNFYTDELRKVLTRIHDNCKVIVIGHTGQVDLFHHAERSGFAAYIEHFRNESKAEVCTLTKNYRGWLSNHADTIVEPLEDSGHIHVPIRAMDAFKEKGGTSQ